MVVYVDLIILANFFLDYSLIIYSGIIANSKIKIWRIILATLFAVSGLSLFYIQIKWLFLLLRLLLSFGIIYIAYPYQSFRQYIKSILIFYFLNYVMAGIIISFDFNFFNHLLLVEFNHAVTWYVLVFSFIIANIMTYIYKLIEENHSLDKSMVLDVKFRLLNHEYQARGLIDTGNRVTSEKDHLPIVFIDKDILNNEISEEDLLKNNVKHTYVSYKTIQHHYYTMAFLPEFFGVVIDKEVHQKEVYIAIIDNIKSKEHSFNVILNFNILLKNGGGFYV